MNLRSAVKPQSMPFAIGVAVILLAAAYVIPLTSSLGQGVDEHIVTSWQAGLDKVSGQEMLIINHNGEAPSDIPIHGLSKQLFTTTSSDGMILTALNQVPILMDAYRQAPQAVEEQFGTNHNAPKLFHPYSNEPIAYSTGFLKTLSKLNLNPDQFGGPNIPPNTYSYSSLPAGDLQIDTRANGNTIVQCQPGQTPQTLAGLPRLPA